MKTVVLRVPDEELVERHRRGADRFDEMWDGVLYDKLPFFARLGVGEVIVVDRDTKRAELFRLAGSQYVAVQADADRWLGSEVMNVRFTRTGAGRLVIEDLGDDHRLARPARQTALDVLG